MSLIAELKRLQADVAELRAELEKLRESLPTPIAHTEAIVSDNISQPRKKRGRPPKTA